MVVNSIGGWCGEETILVGFGFAIWDLKLVGMAGAGSKGSAHKWGHGDGYEGKLDFEENYKTGFNTAVL